ncbi:UbiA family prenyltransferase [Phaeovulum sp.]|uniref:UbiA family prenyltransferase n=1 Tax=Phaeovulum sp. TaxID=2934796 RepID=UPI0035648E54
MATLVGRLRRAVSLLITYRAYHAVLYALFALVVARMSATPVRGRDYAVIVLASVAIFVWNTVLDRAEDAIARPDMSAAISERHAKMGSRIGATLALAALALASVGGHLAAIAALAYVLVAAFGYSNGLGGRPWKRIFLVKTLVAVSGWVCLTVIFPVLNAPPGLSLSELSVEHWAALVWVTSFFAVGETGSDIKDIAADAAVGGKTVATTLGGGGTVAVTLALSLPGLISIATLVVANALAPQFWFMAATPTVLAVIFALSWLAVRDPRFCLLRNPRLQDLLAHLWLLVLLAAAIWLGG